MYHRCVGLQKLEVATLAAFGGDLYQKENHPLESTAAGYPVGSWQMWHWCPRGWQGAGVCLEVGSAALALALASWLKLLGSSETT